jgi:hypothetical protein
MSTLLANTAIDLAIAALLTAVALAITNAAGYISVRTKLAAQGAHISDLQAQQASGAAPTTIVTVPPAPSGQGRTPLLAPAWNQLNDPLPDGALDPQSTTDCGEESTAMAIAACGGPPLPAGVLRQILGGPGRTGATTAADLSYLLTLFGVKNHVRQANADAAWLEWQHSFQARYLVLALGYWVTPGYAHWVLVRETDSNAVLFNDPWGGQIRTLSRDEAQKLYMGVYVHVDQAVVDAAPGPPA